MNGIRKCEILAPAGSFECMKAAFCAGADAVYAGGSLFGARAFAQNFQSEELIRTIEYAHIHGRKFYLTVNTLLKEKELKQELFSYLLPLYESGLDAVIVQDYGVMKWIHEQFPDLAIHASTQMNITGENFARELVQYGVTRIVTARELSLSEIKKIYDATGLEIESFVHGALCYGYSGQCLFSSLNGGRSGNRGKCAQPCRLPYEVMQGEDVFYHCQNCETKKTDLVQKSDEKYLLSPKDLCTLELLPDILEAGVFSLKIEGRMKKPEYVASVTAMYRKYVDLYEKNGKAGYHVEREDIDILREIYNRGGFTDGYYKRHNGKEMMSLNRPNHCGIEVGKIVHLGADIGIQTEIPLDKGDVLEFDAPNISANYTIGSPIAKNTKFQIRNKFQNNTTITKKSLKTMTVFRIRNNQLIDEITKNYIQKKCVAKVQGNASFLKGNPAKLELFYQGIHIEEVGGIVEQAGKRPLSASDIEEKLRKTGDTEFVFSELTIECEEDIFYPLKELNELRRKAFEHLREAVIVQWRRTYSDSTEKQEDDKDLKNCKIEKVNVSALVNTEEQFLELVQSLQIDKIYVELGSFSYENLAEMMEKARKKQKQMYLALPYIFRTQAKKELEANRVFFEQADFDGFVIRNMEEYFFCMNTFTFENPKEFIFDSTIYCFNRESASYLQQYQPLYLGASLELNATELEGLSQPNMELMIYGAIPVLFSANCIKKTLGQCNHQTAIGEIVLKDRKNETILIANHCRYCYNVLYHTEKLWLLDEREAISNIKPISVKLAFTNESAAEVRTVLNAFETIQSNPTKLSNHMTKGHFRRGVQ